MLEWGQVDLVRGFISLIPRKTARKTAVASADLNRRANETMRAGEKGTVDCGFRFEIEPMIAPQPGLNQIGAATLKNLDLLFDDAGVSLRGAR